MRHDLPYMSARSRARRADLNSHGIFRCHPASCARATMVTDEGAEHDARRRTPAKVTLADVAHEAGVSPAAASLAIRGEPGVSRETRDRVAAARRIGYRGISGVHPADEVGHDRADHQGARRRRARGEPLLRPGHGGDRGDLPDPRVDLLFAAMPVDADYHPLEVPRLVTDRATDGLIIIGAHLSRGTASALVDWPPSILVDAYAEDASPTRS